MSSLQYRQETQESYEQESIFTALKMKCRRTPLPILSELISKISIYIPVYATTVH